MTTYLSFTLPSDFVLERCLPTSTELAYAALEGLIEPQTAIEIAQAKVRSDTRSTPSERALAALDPSSGEERTVQLLTTMQVGSDPIEVRQQVWIFLAVAWVDSHREDFDDPLEVVARVYSFFDYPQEMRDFIYWSPAGPEGPIGRDGLFRVMRAYVNEKRILFADRRW